MGSRYPSQNSWESGHPGPSSLCPPLPLTLASRFPPAHNYLALDFVKVATAQCAWPPEQRMQWDTENRQSPILVEAGSPSGCQPCWLLLERLLEGFIPGVFLILWLLCAIELDSINRDLSFGFLGSISTEIYCPTFLLVGLNCQPSL